MAGGRLWTEDEDDAIRVAAAENLSTGEGIGGRGRIGRLRAVADVYGRSYGAVRNRAIRIGAYSRPVGVVTTIKQAGSQGAVAARQRGAHGAGPSANATRGT